MASEKTNGPSSRYADDIHNTHQQIGTQAAFELAIMKSFCQMAKQAHEMAGAITLYLEGPDCTGFVPGLDLQEIAVCRQ